MKAATGILLVGGGVFLLIALFNGTLHFPLGNVNPSGSSNPLGNFFNEGQMGPLPAGGAASKPGLSPVGTAINNKCPSGFINNNGICYVGVGVPAKGK
jgi:hypothetical protein